MRAIRSCVLSVLLTMAAHGGISDALSAYGAPLPQAPIPSSRAVPASSQDIPAGGTIRDAPGGDPRSPNSTPMPAPAPTNHYAGLADRFLGV
jgi:hypothetical protein